MTVLGSSYDWFGLTVRFRFVFSFNLKSVHQLACLVSTTLTVHLFLGIINKSFTFYLFYANRFHRWPLAFLFWKNWPRDVRHVAMLSGHP